MCFSRESRNQHIDKIHFINYNYLTNLEKNTSFDLPERIDYVLITHAHQDHVLIEHLLQIRHQVDNVIVPTCSGGFLQDPSLKELMKQLGFKNIISMSTMEEIIIPNGKICAIPFMGEHGDLNIQSKTSFCVEIFDKKILFAADSNDVCPSLYLIIKEIIGNIDVIF